MAKTLSRPTTANTATKKSKRLRKSAGRRGSRTQRKLKKRSRLSFETGKVHHAPKGFYATHFDMSGKPFSSTTTDLCSLIFFCRRDLSQLRSMESAISRSLDMIEAAINGCSKDTGSGPSDIPIEPFLTNQSSFGLKCDPWSGEVRKWKPKKTKFKFT